jgi:hypothetical protein
MTRYRPRWWALGLAVLLLVIVAVVSTNGSFHLGEFQQTGTVEIPLIPDDPA